MSYGLEIDMIAKAREKDMLTTPYVFSEAEAAAMAIAGADIIVCHLGLTTGGSIGAQTALKLADCPALIDAWAEAALSVNSRDPRARAWRSGREPADADFIMQEHPQLPRLLRRLLDGAPAGGAGADGSSSEIQGDRRALSAGTKGGNNVGESDR